MYFLIILILCFIYLLSINYLSLRTDFCLDKVTVNEKHKLLLSSNRQKVPLSGFLFFLPCVLYFFKNENIYFLLTVFIIFQIGFFSDIKILKSPKLRLFIQIFLILAFTYFFSNLKIFTRIDFLDNFNSYDVYRIFFVSICFLVLINGYNFIDGVNTLSSLNFLSIIFILYLISNKIGLEENFENVFYLIYPLIVFCGLNFFNKNFLGDGAVYGISFIIGYYLINLSLLDNRISPYFIANLLFYPAFENLFSIVRRLIKNKKNYLPDNNHFHQLLFKYIYKKNIFKKKYLASSITGILINTYLFIFYYVGMLNYNNTKFQIGIIFFNIFVYTAIYLKLKNK